MIFLYLYIHIKQYNMKVQKTFTIDNEISKKFDKISKDKSINKSLFIENSIKEFIKKNENKK